MRARNRLRIVDLHGAMLADLPGHRGGGDGLWLGDNTLLAQSVRSGRASAAGLAGPAGNVLLISQEEAVQGEDFGSRESPNGRWALSEGETIVYPKFLPQGVSNWVLVSTQDGRDLTDASGGHKPNLQPLTPAEEAAASPLQAAQSVLQYYPFELPEACAEAAASGVCIEELGSSGSEIVFVAVDPDDRTAVRVALRAAGGRGLGGGALGAAILPGRFPPPAAGRRDGGDSGAGDVRERAVEPGAMGQSTSVLGTACRRWFLAGPFGDLTRQFGLNCKGWAGFGQLHSVSRGMQLNNIRNKPLLFGAALCVVALVAAGGLWLGSRVVDGDGDDALGEPRPEDEPLAMGDWVEVNGRGCPLRALHSGPAWRAPTL